LTATACRFQLTFFTLAISDSLRSLRLPTLADRFFMQLRPLVLFLLLFVFGVTFGQDMPIQTNNASSIRWSQINTPGFRIIYPAGFDLQAQRVANTLETVREPESKSLGVLPRKIPVILQTQTTVSNGFVTMAPRRSEFFAMAPQNYNDVGTNDWLNLLASHEYRHIVQFQRSLTGVNKAIYYAFGQSAASLVAFAAAPEWFWEGDAVATETAYTSSGRGRMPNFDILFRTNFQEGRVFNYEKQYLRSYKHNIPDHYVLGYHMISYLRKKTGDPRIWERITGRSWAHPYIPFGFSRSIRKETGLSVAGLYREMALDLKTSWTSEAEANRKSEFQQVSIRKTKAYVDYAYPQVLEDGSVVVLKSGIGDISQVVVLKDGVESKKFVTGPVNDAGMLSVAGGLVVWNEFRYDPRWRAHTYNIVRRLDLGRLKAKDVTHKSRYSAGALSPDAKRIVTVEFTSLYEARMVIVDAGSGRSLQTFSVPAGSMVSMPRWSTDGSSIVALITKDGQRSVVRYNNGGQQPVELIAPSRENVGHPVLHGKYLFYNSPYSGVDNIYVLDTSSGKKYQVTSSKYGSYNPAISPDGDWIYYNEQTRDGLDVVRVALEPSFWLPLDEVVIRRINLYEPLVEQEAHPDLLKSVPEKKYQATSYNKLAHLINVHSWGPYFNSDVTTATIGIFSKDILSTTVTEVGYQFDLYERTGFLRGAVSYQGLYPVIDAEGIYGKRSDKSQAFDSEVRFNWTETGGKLSARLPFVLTRGKNISSLTLKEGVGVTQVSDFTSQTIRNNLIIRNGSDRVVGINDTLSYIFADKVGNGILVYNDAVLSFSRYWRTSRRDINPKWGQLVDAEMLTTPFGGDYTGYQTGVRGVFFFPGLMKHHSFFARVGYQRGTDGYDVNRYLFRNLIFKPRGFSYPRQSEFTTLSGNYTMPVWYPDIALGGLVNFQRVRTNIFYDYGQGVGRQYYYHDNGTVYSQDISETYQSAGVEVTFDINVMRLLPQLDIGFRFTKGISRKEDSPFEFLIGTLNF
jgi:hypothetical protein